jgi:hypothetical protein
MPECLLPKHFEMTASTPMKQLRIYMSNTDKLRYTPLYQAIVYAAHRNGLAGATVVKGIMGYGGSSEVHSAGFWETNEKLPVVVEIIDTEQKIESFVKIITPYLASINQGCLVTIQDVHVTTYKVER